MIHPQQPSGMPVAKYVPFQEQIHSLERPSPTLDGGYPRTSSEASMLQ